MRGRLFDQSSQMNSESSDSFTYESENKSNGFCVKFKKNQINGENIGLNITFILYDEKGEEERFSELGINNDPEILTVFDDAYKAIEEGFDSFINILKNLKNDKARITAGIF